MASFASRTMQKLFSARLLLEHLADADNQDELVRPAFKTAHIEAVLFQMQGAFQSLLYEIAETARLPKGEWHNSQDLQAAAEQHERFLPQLNILLELENDSFSWLSQFQQRYKSCWLPEYQVVTEVKEQAATASLISVANDAISDQQQLTLWLESMQALIKDLRLTMQEF